MLVSGTKTRSMEKEITNGKVEIVMLVIMSMELEVARVPTPGKIRACTQEDGLVAKGMEREFLLILIKGNGKKFGKMAKI